MRHISHLSHSYAKKTEGSGLFLIIATLLFVIAIYTNIHRVAMPQRFAQAGALNESYVLDRITASRMSGLFSYGLLTGRFMPQHHDREIASATYVVSPYTLRDSLRERNLALQTFRSQKAPAGKYHLYLYQSGVPLIILTMLDFLIPFQSNWLLPLSYLIQVVLMSLALALVLRWCWLQIGRGAAWGALALLLFCAPLIAGGRNIFFQYWSYLLPLLYAFHYLYRQQLSFASVRNSFWLWTLTLVVPLLSGFPYSVVALLSAAAPLCYYALIGRWPFRRFVRTIALALLGYLIALLAVALLLGLQYWMRGIDLQSVWQQWGAYIAHISGAADNGVASNSALPLTEVVRRYLRAPLIIVPLYGTRLSLYLSINHLWLMVALLIGTVFFLHASTAHGRRPHRCFDNVLRYKHIALAVAVIVSGMPPLVWLVLFKNFALALYPYATIVWLFPTLLFAALYLGCMLSEMIQILVAARAKH